MDYDRKSVGSSFYGGRRSADVLQRDFPDPRARQDEVSSFYGGAPGGAARPSVEMLNQPSAGYNSSQFFDAGRAEPVKGGYDEEAGYRDEPFDIYADFNNEGPRYSRAAFMPDDGYRRVNSPTSLVKVEDTPTVGGAPVEMVTVPALGPEWKKDELRGMTKAAKREDAAERRAQKWKEWKRGERGMCGRYFTRKFTAWFLFFLCCAVGIVLAFTIPRVPGFQINADNPLTNASASFAKQVPTQFSRAPANFSFAGSVDLQIDTNSNFLPLAFTSLDADVYDLDTSRHIGTGHLDGMTLPAKEFSHVALPLNFSYVATNDSDKTWNNWYNGCKNKALFTDGKRPTVQFHLVLDFKIAGLIGEKHTATDVTQADCPVELPQNSV